ncbi:MAG: hypothetical protein WD278_07955 [Pirellulales bacterium]
MHRSFTGLALLILGCGLAMAAEPAGAPSDAPTARATEPRAASGSKSTSSKGKAKYSTESIRGRVVWLADALRERFGVATDADAQKAAVALETPEGELHPIVKDFRGRGFHLDPQLHELDLELLVRRYHGSPMVQVVRVYSLKPDGKYELDYWCDICSIPMYELKECECCQGPIHLRERPVDADKNSDHDGPDHGGSPPGSASDGP